MNDTNYTAWENRLIDEQYNYDKAMAEQRQAYEAEAYNAHLIELMGDAIEAFEQLAADLIAEYGKRNPEDDGLFPVEEQPPLVARAMELINYGGRKKQETSPA